MRDWGVHLCVCVRAIAECLCVCKTEGVMHEHKLYVCEKESVSGNTWIRSTQSSHVYACVTTSQFKHTQAYRPVFRAPVQLYLPARHKASISSLRATLQRVKTISSDNSGLNGSEICSSDYSVRHSTHFDAWSYCRWLESARIKWQFCIHIYTTHPTQHTHKLRYTH